MTAGMTDEQRKAAIEISKCLCLSCKHNPKIDEYYLIRQSLGGVESMLYCKSLSARASYDKHTRKCYCTAYERHTPTYERHTPTEILGVNNGK